MKNFLKKLFGSKKELTSPIGKEVNNKYVQKTEKELKKEIDRLQINGYHLPKSMINRIRNNKWKAIKEKYNLEDLLKEVN